MEEQAAQGFYFQCEVVLTVLDSPFELAVDSYTWLRIGEEEKTTDGF